MTLIDTAVTVIHLIISMDRVALLIFMNDKYEQRLDRQLTSFTGHASLRHSTDHHRAYKYT